MGEEALSAVWLQAGLNSDRPLNEIIVVVVGGGVVIGGIGIGSLVMDSVVIRSLVTL